ncbi:hypothetical protein E2320_021540 [Naja naja]|nr:hypothetical protein E2320_021540 [Naja naja]
MQQQPIRFSHAASSSASLPWRNPKGPTCSQICPPLTSQKPLRPSKQHKRFRQLNHPPVAPETTSEEVNLINIYSDKEFNQNSEFSKC